MASIHSKLFAFFLRLIGKKHFLKTLLATGRQNFYSSPEPTTKVYKFCIVDKRLVNGHPVFTLQSRAGRGRKHILYLHGGAYVQRFTSHHWSFMTELVAATHCTISAPDYPLAPDFTFEDTFNMILALYKELLEKVAKEDLIVMGDSSGGGLALALCQLLVKEQLPQPGQLILLSPWLDISLSNPEIHEIVTQDPFMGLEGLLQAGRIYAGNAPLDHYLLSPIYGSFKGLEHISVFVGTREILVADARKLKKMIDPEDVQFIYVEYPGMVHDWMLINLPESKQARQQIISIIETGGL
ncbi:alpha/beta hydrolase [Chitinophaga sp. CC14]|uniref:alpha/beta hydrolase n=1 Tax=Chitinophaga sp. CC14 TaxID=3029199 RepID=UPI003B7C5A3D